jgi:ribosome biogenesis SPOUT family RNA methylase Rps3
MKVTSEKMSDESLVSMKRKAMEDISSITSKVIRGILCDMHKQRHRTSTVSRKKKTISS